jgi:ribonuclease H2 subunit A
MLHQFYGELKNVAFSPELEVDVGIDEAGRGPVLGPMVYGIACYPTGKLADLQQTGVNDSKKLTELKRSQILNKLSGVTVTNFLKDLAHTQGQAMVGWQVRVIPPWEISALMNAKRGKITLNEISFQAAFALVRKVLEAGFKVRQVYVDTVGDVNKYTALFIHHFPQLKGKVTVAQKADALFPVVGAASIFAKVCRDHCMENFPLFIKEKNWKLTGVQMAEPVKRKAKSKATKKAKLVGSPEPEPEEVLELSPASVQPKEIGGLNPGSGYPGDPVTKAFLRNIIDPVFGFPSLVRFTWSTASKLLEERGCIACSFEKKPSTANASLRSRLIYEVTEF